MTDTRKHSPPRRGGLQELAHAANQFAQAAAAFIATNDREPYERLRAVAMKCADAAERNLDEILGATAPAE